MTLFSKNPAKPHGDITIEGTVIRSQPTSPKPSGWDDFLVHVPGTLAHSLAALRATPAWRTLSRAAE